MFKIIKSIYEIFIGALFQDNTDKQLYKIPFTELQNILKPAPNTPISNTFSILAYKDERVRQMIWDIKYHKHSQATQIAGLFIYENIKNLNNENTLLIPIPITNRRRRERGYNQVEMILDIVKVQDINKKFIIYTKLLKRKVHKDRHTLKNRKERLVDAKGIFEIDTDELINFNDKNIKIIIIDDVLTTGSTLKEAMDTFHIHGFNNVSGLTIAH